MTEVWYCDLNSVAVEEHTYQQLLAQLPVEEQERISRFHFRKDKLLSLLGLYMVHERAGSLEGFGRTEFGKPFLESSDLEFNISHSGDLVVSVFSTTQPVGIDVEQIREIDFSDFHIVMTDSEMTETNSLDDFFTLWAQKESVIKAIGKGFSLNVKDLRIENNSCSFAAQNWKLEEISLNPTYKCFVAAQEKAPIQLKAFTPKAS